MTSKNSICVSVRANLLYTFQGETPCITAGPNLFINNFWQILSSNEYIFLSTITILRQCDQALKVQNFVASLHVLLSC